MRFYAMLSIAKKGIGKSGQLLTIKERKNRCQTLKKLVGMLLVKLVLLRRVAQGLSRQGLRFWKRVEMPQDAAAGTILALNVTRPRCLFHWG